MVDAPVNYELSDWILSLCLRTMWWRYSLAKYVLFSDSLLEMNIVNMKVSRGGTVNR